MATRDCHQRRESAMASEIDTPIVNKLHAEGSQIQAEWERLRLNKARDAATEEDLASHRLSFFLGAVAIWQTLQEAGDNTSVVDVLQDELEGFLSAMEAEGHITLSDGQPLQ
jgi:hypothetical protein